MDSLRQTSGTVSLRINQLSHRGLVQRKPDLADGRSVLVTLTDTGRDLFDAAAPAHLANEDQLLTALTPDQRRHLADLLRTLLIEFDQPTPGRPDTSLGFTAAQAHAAQRRRAAVGLPPAPGLLIESVQPHTWASAAGLTPGDLITHAGTTELRSLTCLADALSASREGVDVTLTIHRGGRSIHIDAPASRDRSQAVNR
jgi:C-terminal processing protease CtpA/Prc